jgi:hypothetical protein
MMSFFSGRSRPLYRPWLWLRARSLSRLLLWLRIRISLYRLRSALYRPWLLLLLLWLTLYGSGLRLALYRWLLLRLTLHRP